MTAESVELQDDRLQFHSEGILVAEIAFSDIVRVIALQSGHHFFFHTTWLLFETAERVVACRSDCERITSIIRRVWHPRLDASGVLRIAHSAKVPGVLKPGGWWRRRKIVLLTLSALDTLLSDANVRYMNAPVTVGDLDL